MYILNNLMIIREHSNKCLGLSDDKTLSVDLYNFFTKHREKDKIMPVFLNKIPTSLSSLKDDNMQHSLFINIALPLILDINKQILKERKTIVNIHYKLLSEPLNASDFNSIRLFASKYNIKMLGDNFWDYTSALEELLLRVDVVPAYVLLAIAIHDTSWGMDTSLSNTKSLFPSFAKYMIAKSLDGRINYRYQDKEFETLKDSIIYYYNYINKDKSYSTFRNTRSSMRNDDYFNLLRFLSSLLHPSGASVSYINAIYGMILSYKLSMYGDNIKYQYNDNDLCLYIK